MAARLSTPSCRRRAPEGIEGRGAPGGIDLSLPSGLQILEIRAGHVLTQASQARQQDVFSLARVMNRTHHRLAQAQEIRGGLEIAPCLQPMVFGQSPPALERGFVLIETDPELDRDAGRG